MSRGFLQAENIEFERTDDRNHPFNTETNYLYSSIGTVTLDVTFADCRGRWKVDAKVVDHQRLCKFDDVRINSSVATGFEVQDDRPLWFDVLLGRVFQEDFPGNMARPMMYYRKVGLDSAVNRQLLRAVDQQ